jgi:AhpD family alkylhydroperoxidase
LRAASAYLFGIVEDVMQQQRINAMKVSPEAYKAMAGLQTYVDQSGLEPSLIELVKIRASQINGCAYCLVMHTNDARKHGETDDRMHLLNAWREAPTFSERERAALGWVEAVTLVSESHVPDEVYETVKQHFSEKEIVDLTMAVVAINGWNRIAIASRAAPQVKSAKAAAA